MNDAIRRAITQRNIRYTRGDDSFRSVRNKVQREISSARKSLYSRKVEHLKHSEPGKWHQQIRTTINNFHDQVIWNNSSIRINNNTQYNHNWYNNGIKYYKDLLQDNGDTHF